MILLTTSFPGHPADFAGAFVAGQAAALAALGARVRVLAPHAEWAPPGVEVVRYSAPQASGWPEALEARPVRAALGGLSLLAGLRRTLRRVARPDDVVVAHWLPLALAAERLPNPLVAWCHGGDLALLERLPRLAGRIARRGRLVFVSAALRERFGALVPGEYPVLPMGVSPPRPESEAVAAYRALAGGRRIVATVGRQVPIKGLDVLAEAIAGRQDLCWLAAGEGPACPPLAHRLGVLAPAQRNALLQAADVFVHPSRPLANRTEGAPVAVMEAVTAGAPVVASDTGGIREVAPEARLVPPDDPRALAAALDAALAGSRPAPDPRHLWAAVAPRHAALVERAHR